MASSIPYGPWDLSPCQLIRHSYDHNADPSALKKSVPDLPISELQYERTIMWRAIETTWEGRSLHELA